MNVKRLKELMQQHNVNQAELADVAGVSQAFMSYVLSGKKIPSLDVLKRMAALFDVTLDEIA